MQFSITLLALVSTVFSIQLSDNAIACGCATNNVLTSFARCFCDDEMIKLDDCLPLSWPIEPKAVTPNAIDASQLQECIAKTGAKEMFRGQSSSVTSTATATASSVKSTSTKAPGYGGVTSSTKAAYVTVAPKDDCTTKTTAAPSYGTQRAVYNSASTSAVGLALAAGLMILI